MADIQSNEDAALRYVLGELNATERRKFESLMMTSTELSGKGMCSTRFRPCVAGRSRLVT